MACATAGCATVTSPASTSPATGAASPPASGGQPSVTTAPPAENGEFGSLPPVVKPAEQLWEFVVGAPGAFEWSPTGETLGFASSVGIYLYRYADFSAEPILARIDPNQGAPYDLAFSPDGSLVAATTEAGVRIWDARTGTEVASLTLPSAGNLEFAGDATLMALGADHLVAFDVAAGTVSWQTPVEITSSHTFSGRLAVDSATGQVLYGTGLDTVVRSVATGEVIFTHPGSDAVVAVAFSADGQGILMADRRSVRLLDRATGDELDASAHPVSVGSMSLVVDGADVFLVTNGLIARWQPSSVGDSAAPQTVFEDAFYGYHPIGDGTALTSIGFFGGVSQVRSEDLTVVTEFDADRIGAVDALAVEPTLGRVAVATNSEVVVFDLATPAELVANRGGPLRGYQVHDATLAEAADAVAWTSLAGRRGIVWDPHTNELIESIELPAANRTHGVVLDGKAGLAIFDDGETFSTMAYAGPTGVTGIAREKLAGGTDAGYLVTHDINCLTVRDSDSLSVVGSIQTGYNVWRFAVTDRLVVTEGFGDFEGIRAFELTGPLASGDECAGRRQAPVWELAIDGILVGTWSQQVLVLSESKLVRIDLLSGRVVDEVAIDLDSGRAHAVAFDPEGGRLAVNTGSVVGLYSIDSGSRLATFRYSGNLAFDPSGRFLMVYSRSGIWIVDVGAI